MFKWFEKLFKEKEKVVEVVEVIEEEIKKEIEYIDVGVVGTLEMSVEENEKY